MSRVLRIIHNNIKLALKDKIDCIEYGEFNEKEMTIMFQIKCPDESAWEGQYHRGKIYFPSNFPHNPPKVKFITNVFHPNIYVDGKVCISILDDNGWSSAQGLNSILLSIISLFSEPNIDSPANCDANNFYRNDKQRMITQFKLSISNGKYARIEM